MMIRAVFVLLCSMMLVPLPRAAGAETRVTIFAAASLKTVLDTIAPDLPHPVTLAYGGSAAMARQVAQGAEADIVILAHPQWMDWAEEQGALVPDTRCDLVGNRLVLAGPAGAEPFVPDTADALLRRLGDGRLATGRIQTVPAGQYTEEWLENAGWLGALRPHLAEVSNVRLALALIARGETPMGVVYHSDVVAEPKTAVLYTIPRDMHAPIRYPAALTQQAGEPARQVLRALSQSSAAFGAAGFAPLPTEHAEACK